ncbi:hypothetical protein FIU97_14640 [Roseivivax sp. THAF40]|uniref:hypothetical protein n=1 Tax=Roseivivax sp. THAF40 TaxID=2587858 RepID=UPI001268F487|nr:hypothetical protein [Roseivivax sp. THAF40]QFT47817.1 hypothetical protein FIU97_14640 [Roseivivax sp. THAF40]
MSKPDVHVKMSAPFSYRTGSSTKRTLPAGWSGFVPDTVAAEIEKEKAGERTPAKDAPAQAASKKKGRKPKSEATTGASGAASTDGGKAAAETSTSATATAAAASDATAGTAGQSDTAATG